MRADSITPRQRGLALTEQEACQEAHAAEIVTGAAGVLAECCCGEAHSARVQTDTYRQGQP